MRGLALAVVVACWVLFPGCGGDGSGPAADVPADRGPGDAAGDAVEDLPDPCRPDCDGRECGADGCGGLCGACTEPEVCVLLTGTCSLYTVPVTSFGPAGLVSALRIPGDEAFVRASCADFTGDGFGDSSLAAIADAWNPGLGAAVDAAGFRMILEFLGADDFVDETEFRLTSLIARPGPGVHPDAWVVSRDSFGPDHRPWTKLPASIAAGVVDAGPGAFRLALPFGAFRLDLDLEVARVRGAVDADSSVVGGVSMAGGVLAGLVRDAEVQARLADIQARCDAAPEGSRPAACADLPTYRQVVLLAMTLHDRGEGAMPRFVPASAGAPGDTAAICLAFDLSKVVILELEPEEAP